MNYNFEKHLFKNNTQKNSQKKNFYWMYNRNDASQPPVKQISYI